MVCDSVRGLGEREIQTSDESTVSFFSPFSLTWLCQESGNESEEKKRDELEMSQNRRSDGRYSLIERSILSVQKRL